MAELDANLVLILTAEYGKNNLVRPSTDFNHCIAKVKINNEYFYLELTDKNLPFKSLPMSLRGATALDIPFNVSKDDNIKLYHLNPDNRMSAKFISEYKMFVNDSTTSVDLSSTIVGHLASYYIKIKKEENDELLEESIFDDINGRTSETIELKSLKSMDYKRDEGSISFNTILDLDLEINEIGEYYTFKVPKFINPYSEEIIKLKTRNYPIDYKQYENSDYYQEMIEINLSKAYKFVEIPQGNNYTYKGHDFSIEYKLVKPNVLEIDLMSKVNSDNISPDEYQKFKSFVRKVLDTKDTLIKYKKV
jgi:hypothetical protein